MSRSGSAGVALAATALLAAACTGAAESTQQPYRFNPTDAAVQVDTAQLREMKAEAGIPDCPVSDADASVVHDGLPDVTLPCLGGGREVHLAGLRGVPSVLNFWSQTCGPCRTESPILQRVHELAGDRVRMVGVDWQDPRPSYAIGFAEELGLTYPQIADPEGATRAPLRITALPITVFVTADGRIVHTESGPVESVHDLATLISDHLHVTITPPVK